MVCPAFAGIHCAYAGRDGQAELTLVAGYIPREFTHHHSTDRVSCTATTLIETACYH